MICPHCKKAIPTGLNSENKKRIKQLASEKYSTREIEKILFSDGHQVSFSTIAKYLRGLK